MIRFDTGTMLTVENLLRLPHRKGHLEYSGLRRKRPAPPGTPARSSPTTAGYMMNMTPSYVSQDRYLGIQDEALRGSLSGWEKQRGAGRAWTDGAEDAGRGVCVGSFGEGSGH